MVDKTVFSKTYSSNVTYGTCVSDVRSAVFSLSEAEFYHSVILMGLSNTLDIWRPNCYYNRLYQFINAAGSSGSNIFSLNVNSKSCGAITLEVSGWKIQYFDASGWGAINTLKLILI